MQLGLQRDPDFSEPLRLHDSQVRPDWLDYNGHMTESRYLQVFGDTTDAFLNFIGMDENYRKQGFSVYTVETHIRHVCEVAGGEPRATVAGGVRHATGVQLWNLIYVS